VRTREEVRAERRTFVREHDGRMAWQITERLQQLLETSRQRADAAALQLTFAVGVDGSGDRLSLPAEPEHQLFERLIRLYVLQSPGFAEWLTGGDVPCSSAGPRSMKSSQRSRRTDILAGFLLGGQDGAVSFVAAPMPPWPLSPLCAFGEVARHACGPGRHFHLPHWRQTAATPRRL
jgi:hypothetical protein